MSKITHLPHLAGLLLLLPLLLYTNFSYAQSVGIGTPTPDAKAALDIVSSGKGLLIPRLTAAQRGAIAAPPQGLLVYQTDAPEGFYYFGGSPGAWVFINPAGGGADNLGNHTATQPLNLQAQPLVGTGADVGTSVGLGVRADGGLNLGQNGDGNNVLLGYQAGQLLAPNGTGFRAVYNQMMGYQAGKTTTTGSYNHFNGYKSGFSNTTGTSNQFSGYRSGFSNTTGNYNQFSGSQSGNSNTTGSYNYFSGFNSGYYNTTGSNNQFSGYQSGINNTTGSSNQFDGYQSGYNSSTGFSNQFSGYQSGYRNITGGENQFIGFQSGYNNTTGNRNLFVGLGAGNNNASGNENVFVGYNCGGDDIRSSGNTAIGAYSGTYFSEVTNSTALGYAALIANSNTIQLGNNLIQRLSCQVGLTTPSDARFKYDVRADVPGLAFIQRLRPVSYRFDNARLGAFTRTGELPARSAPDPKAPVQTGFLAQEVEAAAQSVGFAFDGVHAPANARDHYGLGYAQFVVPLVRAVQEQQAQIQELKAQVAAQAGDHAELQAVKAQATAATEAFEARLRRLEASSAQARR